MTGERSTRMRNGVGPAVKRHPGRLVVATMVVAYGALIATVLSGQTPTLGLDLQGGISVNLQPVRDGQVVDDVTPEQLDQAIAIIRRRVDALGVAEPEVSRQGNTILVQLPGAKDQEQVLETVGKTAELRFRPVLGDLGTTLNGQARTDAEAKVSELSTALGLPAGVTAQQVLDDEQAKTPQPPTDPAVTTTVPPTTAAPAVPSATATTIDPTADANTGGGRSARLRQQGAPSTVPTTVPAAPTTTTPPLNQYGVSISDPRFIELYRLQSQLTAQTTPPGEDQKDAEVQLADKDGFVYQLGPTQLTGTAVETATAGIGQDGLWTVNPVFKAGPDGIDLFNAVAAKCNAGDPICPSSQSGPGRLAIVLDSEVLSAPAINEANFSRDQIQISGDFTEEQAKNLAVALRFGSLPIELAPQQAELVSATLGEDALRAGIIAGLIGLGLVFAYLFAYYRLLALITFGSMTISASLLWVIMSNLNATVTLAGVVGIIVSIGISLDSSIVFFEGWKEDVLGGATVRTTVERSFSSAYATIVKADVSSLIGAGVLYWLSVGPVRGFAFYLGVMTLLDLVAAYVFLRPASVLVARSSWAQHPRWLGIPVDTAGVDAAGDSSGPAAPAAEVAR